MKHLHKSDQKILKRKDNTLDRNMLPLCMPKYDASMEVFHTKSHKVLYYRPYMVQYFRGLMLYFMSRMESESNIIIVIYSIRIHCILTNQTVHHQDVQRDQTA